MRWIVSFALFLTLGCSNLPLPTYTLFDCDDPDNFPPTATGQVEVVKSLDPVPGQYIVELAASHATRLMASAAPSTETRAEFAIRYRSMLVAQGEAMGGRNVVALGVIDSFAGEFDKPGLKTLRKNENVVAIYEATKVSIPPVEVLSAGADADPQKLSGDKSWGQDRVNQRPNPLDGNFDQSGYGEGVHVGLIDTGIDDQNAEFAGRMGMCSTAINNPPDAWGCRDDHGHGTHVAGTMAGTHWGLAKQATVHSCRGLQNGSGADWQIIWCIDSHILNKRALDAAAGAPVRYIVNESIGGSYSDPADRANCRMIGAGILNVVAAGNTDISLCHFSPARVLQAVTVGATEYADARTYFSAHDGDAPLCKDGLDMWAPGWNVVSTKMGGCNPKSCPWMSGTSMASPHVAGAAAVYWGLHPEMDQFEVIDAMKANATMVVTDSRSEFNGLVYVGPED
jgi:subtilisin family serine protease